MGKECIESRAGVLWEVGRSGGSGEGEQGRKYRGGEASLPHSPIEARLERQICLRRVTLE